MEWEVAIIAALADGDGILKQILERWRVSKECRKKYIDLKKQIDITKIEELANLYKKIFRGNSRMLCNFEGRCSLHLTFHPYP